MQEQFDDLRQYVFGSQSELLRRRQLIVNVVLAIAILDKALNHLPKVRWSKVR